MPSPRFIPLALLVALTACSPQAPITQPPVTMRFATEARANAVTGFDTAIIRTRLTQSGQTAELASVPCRLNGPGFSADFTTPAALELPLFSNTAPQLALSCRFDGESKSRTLAAQNLSAKERREARQKALDDLAEGDGGARIILSLGLTRRGPDGFDRFRYPDTTFTFRR